MMQQAVSKHLVVLKQAGWWGDLYSHPNERGDSPAHGAVGLPTGSEAGLRRRQEWVAGDELEATPPKAPGWLQRFGFEACEDARFDTCQLRAAPLPVSRQVDGDLTAESCSTRRPHDR